MMHFSTLFLLCLFSSFAPSINYFFPKAAFGRKKPAYVKWRDCTKMKPLPKGNSPAAEKATVFFAQSYFGLAVWGNSYRKQQK